MKGKKRLAASIMKTSPKKVRLVAGALEEVKKAITRADIRGLIAVGKIQKVRSNAQSRCRARKISAQKSKGRQKGRGSKKGKARSTLSRKDAWMLKIRTQRAFIKELRAKGLVSVSDYRKLYNKSKGGYFRNKRHIKLYIAEQQMVQREQKVSK